ncbi:MAG: sigma 54-interacting transcriptional regulator [Acidibacillus sp.]|nr:sigma 54-interacting transcriptional regulator [Acidibacillus sp.]
MEQPIAQSPIMRTLLEQAARVAAFPTTILIEGPTGAGKEVISDFIHHMSPRNTMPFIKINCAALPETLMESELFGYENGAFTGAKRDGNPGLFELADKGTLLLDEIGELPPTLQVKLLRVLQNREVRRIGSSFIRTVDVRILASTNCNLLENVHSGKFREDLYYRLNVVKLSVPPLMNRPEDILPLCHFYLKEFCDTYKIIRQLDSTANNFLQHYDYPGNVRELRNMIEHACVITSDTWVRMQHLPIETRIKEPISQEYSLETKLHALENEVIVRALKRSRSVREASKLLQISHSTLLRKMKKHGISALK